MTSKMKLAAAAAVAVLGFASAAFATPATMTGNYIKAGVMTQRDAGQR